MKILRSVHAVFAAFVVVTLLFIALVVALEQMGLSRVWLGAACFLVSIVAYMGIGLSCRTTQLDQYYVAGRSIPAFYNGMASAADWISAATFISLAGGLYMQGFSGQPGKPGGFAFILGWTGGFCLLAMLAAPQLRRMQLYTLPEFFERRYGGVWPRRLAMVATILCSFLYMVAQIYGVGLIASRLAGVRFEIGMLLGLSGVLVCSFLGGMRAVTWTQVAQYVVLLLAFVIPVSLLAYKQTGNPLAPWAYVRQLHQVQALEVQLRQSPQEREVAALFAARAADDAKRLQDVDAAMQQDRQRLLVELQQIRSADPDASVLFALSRSLEQLPGTELEARQRWQQDLARNQMRSQPLAGMAPVADPNLPDGAPDAAGSAAQATHQRNVLALMACLCMGTLGLPHLLTRYFTTPTVAATRNSVAWTVFFVVLIYLCIPAMAVLVKFEIMHNLVGLRFDALPGWTANWNRVDASLLQVHDINQDGILQFAELQMEPDLVMLAMPEIAGLPFAISAMVAAGGLAAALSTADGLLLTMGTTLAHDGYYREVNPRASETRRVMLSKQVLLVMALAAAYVAAYRPGDILQLVAASFSLGASSFVPAMVAGIFWRGATRAGAVAGMLAGFGVASGYLLAHVPAMQQMWPVLKAWPLWWGIQPLSCGVFGVPAGVLALVVVSWLTQKR